VIGFALNPQAKQQNLRAPSTTYLSKSRTAPRILEPDEDDPYSEDTAEPVVADCPSEYGDEDDVDTDMLPTMLVYRSGQLVHNWVRVDWEAGSLGIDELLKRYVHRYPFIGDILTWMCHRHHIIHPTRMGGSLSVPLDDEDDLIFSAPDDGV
jgi:hypothetical protein